MSIFYMLLIGSNIFNLTLQTFLVVFGFTLPLNVAYYQVFCESFLYFFLLLTLIEISWLKYMHKFVWKSVRPLDEAFVVTCCTLNKTVFCTLLSMAWIQSYGGKNLLLAITDPFEWHMTYWINDDLVRDNNYLR